MLIVAITEFFTETAYWPVHLIAKASVTGHATNIIAGQAIGMMATALPVLVIGIGILLSYALGGLYGIAIAAVGHALDDRDHRRDRLVRTDHRQRRRHRRDGQPPAGGARPSPTAWTRSATRRRP